MRSSMKKIWIVLAAVIGAATFWILLPQFDTQQPRGLEITRERARTIADRAARELGIPVEQSWAVTTWEASPFLETEFARRPELRRLADNDPVVGPRLGGFRVLYFRQGVEKTVGPHGYIIVGKKGEILGARLLWKSEEIGKSAPPAVLRQRADAFVNSRQFPGAPNPVFDSIRPTVRRTRTDHTFRYKVPFTFDAGRSSFFLDVFFNADRLGGWILWEEYNDGSAFTNPSAGSEIQSVFLQQGLIFALLLVVIVLFLRKYHAGEAGIGIASVLFFSVLILSMLTLYLSIAEGASGAGMPGMDAKTISVVIAFLFFITFYLPLAILIFLAWSVGESIARERWGERLASFDALCRRDPLNATTGRSLLTGLSFSPVVAASTLLIGLIGIQMGHAYPGFGNSRMSFFSSYGGALTMLTDALLYSILTTVVSFVFILAYFSRRNLLPLGFLMAVAFATLFNVADPGLAPAWMNIAFGFGGVLAATIIFLLADLLTAAVALFTGILLLGFVPLIRAIAPSAATEAWWGLLVPLVLIAVVGIAGALTRREVSYSYEDLAPHVRRIVERERVKAEIDAANRIQSALLPSEDPKLSGASVASHYRAASEIGGDYFDFLPLPDGSIGVAFGDVAGHGLTSGIVMAMAKAALLVQVGYDASPVRVMEVLNETVIKTAPKRMLMTFFFGVLEPERHRLTFSSAGHLDPYVFRGATKTLESLSSWGYPLGVKRRENFREITAQFSVGDRLILYSDGFIEALDDHGEPFGFDRFENVLAASATGSAEEIRKALLNSVKKFTRNRPPADDQTLVVISFEEPFATHQLKSA